MGVVAIIPARGGSKGILRKNLQPIEGIPLVGWTVRAAIAAESVDMVFVSTEDAEIATVAEQHGAGVIRRPAELAADEATTPPVVQHAIRILKEDGDAPDVVVLLECTSPLMEPADIDAAVAKLQHPGVNMATTVCEDHAFQLRPAGSSVEWISHQRMSEDVRRQELPPTYRLAGGVYAYHAEEYLWMGTSFYGNVQTVEIPEWRSVDIDSPVDLYTARALAAMRGQWIVAGSSPSAREGLRRAQMACPAAKTITTNSGHELFNGQGGPDVYHLHDSIACKIHQDHARKMKARGARLVTLDRTNRSALVSRGVDWFDEFLPLSHAHDHPGRFQQGAYASCGLSGLMCLQYALNHGARHVHLIGMEGYADRNHYFGDHADLGNEKDNHFTQTLIEPFVQSCIDACPDVAFTFYGDLNYQVSGDNVQCVS